jgi:hypothetical protein
MALSGIYAVSLSQAQLDSTYASLDDAGGFPGGALGDVCIDNKGGQWMLVKAAEAITQYSLVVISNASLQDGTYLAYMVEAADIATGTKVLGLCLNTISVTTNANPYFWLFRGPGGGFGSGVKVRAENPTAGALLHPLSGTAGAVDDANVDEGVIAGLQTLETTTTIEAVEVYATTILSCNLTEAD